MAPLSNIKAMDVFLPIIDGCWEYGVREKPTVFTPLCHVIHIVTVQ